MNIILVSETTMILCSKMTSPKVNATATMGLSEISFAGLSSSWVFSTLKNHELEGIPDLSKFYLSTDLIFEPFFNFTKISDMMIPRRKSRFGVAMAKVKVKTAVVKKRNLYF